MDWAYIGSGCWELQGGPYLGCLYGSLSGGDRYEVSLEQLQRGGAYVKIREQDRVEGLEEAKRLAFGWYIDRLQNDLEHAQVVYKIWHGERPFKCYRRLCTDTNPHKHDG